MLISKENVREAAWSVGVSEVGVTTAEPLLYMHDKLMRRVKENRVTPFEEGNPAKRLSPRNIFSSCRSIITLALPYAAAAYSSPDLSDQARGTVARCARAIDYHLVVENKALQVVSAIQENYKSDFNYKILSDRSPLVERELARNSSLGIIGENCTMINARFGSYTALGTILIDEEIPPDQVNNRQCLRCGKCREACPTGALTEPYTINPYRCLSYLTQAPGVVSLAMRSLMGRQIYGCDLCQEACPLNEDAESSPYPEMAFSFFPAEPLLIPLLQLTGKEYNHSIGLTSAGWRGKTTLQRNAIIALGNSGDQSAVQTLARLLENDPRPLIRQHTAWALSQLKGKKAIFALEKSLKNDPEPAVTDEANIALINIRQ